MWLLTSSPVRKMQESNGREQAKKAGVRGVSERNTQSNIHGRSGSLQGELPRRNRDAGNTERRIEKQAAATNPQDALATTIAENLIKNGMTFCLCHSSCWKRGMKYWLAQEISNLWYVIPIIWDVDWNQTIVIALGAGLVSLPSQGSVDWNHIWSCTTGIPNLLLATMRRAIYKSI